MELQRFFTSERLLVLQTNPNERFGMSYSIHHPVRSLVGFWEERQLYLLAITWIREETTKEFSLNFRFFELEDRFHYELEYSTDFYAVTDSSHEFQGMSITAWPHFFAIVLTSLEHKFPFYMGHRLCDRLTRLFHKSHARPESQQLELSLF